MASKPTPETAATGKLLRHLLETRDDYRVIWKKKVKRGNAGSEICLAAVARVISFHLVYEGERSDDDGLLHRRVKDTVRRALVDFALTAETLDWFVAAFPLTLEDSEMLNDTFTKAATPELIERSSSGI
jgi:hypothetical protein